VGEIVGRFTQCGVAIDKIIGSARTLKELEGDECGACSEATVKRGTLCEKDWRLENGRSSLTYTPDIRRLGIDEVEKWRNRIAP
jgi:hypothetical protein